MAVPPRIVVYEGTDPLLTLRLKKKVEGGGTSLPYLLNGSPSISFNVKDTPDDAIPLFAYVFPTNITVIADGTAGGATYSEISVQCNAADLVLPGVKYWYLLVTKSAKKDVVKDGFFEIKNI